MIKINVIDLDKTLIPYDSFRELIKNEILRLDIRIIFFSFCRINRLISNEKFKKKTISLINSKYDEDFFQSYATKIYQDIDKSVLNKIINESDRNTCNILLSASPDIYVKLLINKLEWSGKGSYFDENGNFHHLYENGKIEWLKKNFISSKYIYNYAISDGSSDEKLLDLFNKNEKWISR